MKNLELVTKLLNHIHFLNTRQRTRRQLLKLDSAALNDIDISREDAVEEGSQPFWKSRFSDQEAKPHCPQRITVAQGLLGPKVSGSDLAFHAE
jgi:uncharacterized protein YjiS (DUF1127 family)